MPEMDVADLSTLTMKLRARTNDRENGFIRVGVMSNPADSNSFVDVDTIYCTRNDSWEDKNISLANYSGDGHYIAFQSHLSDWHHFYLDNIEVYACPQPRITVAGAHAVKVEVVADSGQAADYWIEYGPQDFDQGRGVSLHVQMDPFVIEGLEAERVYDFYVRCDSAGYSCASPVRLTTAPQLEVPYCEDFVRGDNEFDRTWSRYCAYSSSNPYVNSSNELTFYTNRTKDCYAIMPDIAVDSISQVELYFDMYINSLECAVIVGVMEDRNDVSTFVPVDTVWNTVSSSWQKQHVSLARYSGTGRFIAFCEMTDGYGRYVYIKNLRVQGCPHTTVTLASSTSVRVQVASDQPTVWVEYGEQGFEQGSGETVHVEQGEQLIEGLESGVTYDFYVRCDSGEVTCIEPTSITTLPRVGVPYCESFEEWESEYAAGWVRASSDGSRYPRVYNSSYYSNGGNKSLYFYTPGGGRVYGVLPDVDVEEIGDVDLYFALRVEDAERNAMLVGVSEDPYDTATFEAVDTVRCATGGQYEWKHVSLRGYGGRGRFIAFRSENRHYYGRDLYVDDLIVQGCQQPEMLLTSATTVRMSVDSVHEADYWLEYGPEGIVQSLTDTLWNGDDSTYTLTPHNTLIHITENQYFLTGLQPNAVYDFYARCDSAELSCHPVKRIRTSSTAGVPYCEAFDYSGTSYAQPEGWVRYHSNSSRYSPYVYSSYTEELYFYGSAGEVCQISLPEMEDVNVEGLSLTFRQQNPNIDYTALVVGVSVDPNDPTTFVALDTLRNSASGEWEQMHVSFGGYGGEGRFITLRLYSSYGTRSLYVDDLFVETCDMPQNVRATLYSHNTVRITADTLSTVTGFWVEYGVTGFSPGTGQKVHCTALPYDILLSNYTTYDFYFMCDTASATCRPVQTVETTGEPVSIPYCENFDDVANYQMPTGWKAHNLSNVRVGTSNAHSGNKKLSLYVTNSTHYYAVMPEADVDSVGNLAVSFYMRSSNNNGIGVTVGVMSDPNDGNSFVPVKSFTGSDIYRRCVVALEGVGNEGRFIAFRSDANNHGSGYLYIDDVFIDSCGVHDFRAGETESNYITFKWRQAGNPQITIEYGPAGFVRGEGTTVTADGSPYTLRNLEPLTNYTFYFDAVCDEEATGYCNLNYHDSVTRFTPAGGTGCIDPTNLTADYTTCFYGTYGNPYAHVGVVDLGADNIQSRHTVHHDPTAMDPRTGGQLRMVPEGSDASVRLGNWAYGGAGNSSAQGEAVTYSLYIDTNSFDLIILKYAAVLQDPDHDITEQPRFSLELLDEEMQLLDSVCGAADFIANSNLGWHNAPNNVLWKDWTTVGMDVSQYGGQTIYIRLTTRDCGEGNHYGYAYFTLGCMQKTLLSEHCGEVATNRFSAPSGFAYSWYTNQDTAVFSREQSIEVPTNNEVTYYCRCAFVDKEECNFTLSAFAGTRYPLAQMEYEQRMENCKIVVDFHNTSTISSDGINPIGTGEGCESAWWDLGNGDTVTTYNAQGVYNAPGNYTVTLVSGIAGDACRDTAVYTIALTMDVAPPMIIGPASACEGDSVRLTVQNAQSWQWSTGESDSAITVVSGQWPMVSCVVTNLSGCTDTLYHSLTVHPLYDMERDTGIYEGNFPVEWGSYTIVMDSHMTSGGDTTLTFLYSSVEGCDSTVHYHLSALFDVEVTLDSTVCESALPLTWNDSVFTEAGTKQRVLQTWYGGDSVVTMVLAVESTTYGTYTQAIVENQLPYSFLHHIYTEAVEGDTLMLVNTAGCDSVLSFTLEVYENVGTVLYDTVCETALPWQWNHRTFTEAGTLLDTLQAHTGADSVLTMVLTVHPTTYGTYTQAIVENQLPYTFLHHTYTEAVMGDTLMLTNAAGCDSVLSFTLEVYENVGTVLYDTVCETALPWQWNHRTFATAGTQLDTLQAETGADSVLTMVLTVKATTYGSVTEEVVENALPHSFLHHSYTEAVNGDTLMLTNAAGCDSVLSYTLVVHPNVDTALYDTVCETELPYTWNDSLFTEADTKTSTTTDRYGADSTVTMHLAVIPTTYGIYLDTIVENQLPYSYHHRTYLTDTLADTVHIVNVGGCDSVVTYSLFVHRNVDTVLYDTICERLLPYQWGDSVFVAGGSKAYVIPNRYGADSTVTMMLTVIPTTYDNYTQAIVENQLPYTFLHHTYNEAVSGDTLMLTNAAGCDSVLSYTLVVHPNVDTVLYDTVCETEMPYTWNDSLFTEAGTKIFTTTDRFGADSTVTMHLAVIPTTYGTYLDTIVENQLPYSFYHRTYLTDTVGDTVHIVNMGGCDSVVTYSLFVHRNVYVSLFDSVCDDQLPLQWNHRTFTSAGTQMDTLSAHTGADSLLTMTLTVFPTYLFTDTVDRCQQDFPYEWRDTVFDATTVSGLYVREHLSTAGCDSTWRLQLAVHYAVSDTDHVIACEPYLWIDGIVHQHHDSATFLLQTVHGCDSLVTLDLQMRSPTETFLSDTFCLGTLYRFGERELTEGGHYVDSLLTVDHCDSLVHLDLTGLAVPTLSISTEYDCSTLLYHIQASSDVPYIEWSVAGYDWDSLWGDPHASELWLNPDSVALLILYGDYYPDPTCPHTVEATLHHLEKPHAAIHVTPTILTPENSTATLSATESLWADNFFWYIDGVHYTDGVSFEYTLPYDADSVLVTLVADNGLCSDTASQYILMRNDNLFIPNIFTPNESSNNRFYIGMKGIVEFEMYIYNRTGLLVYESHDINEMWDGTDLNGAPCQQGAYVYRIRYRNNIHPKEWHSRYGTVTLLR